MTDSYEENVASFDKIDSAKAQELIKAEGEVTGGFINFLDSCF